MSRLARIFVLTKSEQRVVIVVVLLLVAIALAKRHYDERGSVSSPALSPSQTAPVRPKKESVRSDDDQ
ncbi:MAG TPA: hypothetical protein VEI58_10895 [Chthoniobacterales bacterium]|nr:hypothetical protein [Chthoniobacterales bacterium]